MDLPDDILRRILRHADYDNGMVVNRGVVLTLTCTQLSQLRLQTVRSPESQREYDQTRLLGITRAFGFNRQCSLC
jgi:hypothetical protein